LGDLSGTGKSTGQSPIKEKKPFTITAEAKALLSDIKSVEQTVGKDARKARLLTITARALLTKLAEASPAVKFLLEGKVEKP
jgi:hypothetical protein